MCLRLSDEICHFWDSRTGWQKYLAAFVDMQGFDDVQLVVNCFEMGFWKLLTGLLCWKNIKIGWHQSWSLFLLQKIYSELIEFVTHSKSASVTIFFISTRTDTIKIQIIIEINFPKISLPANSQLELILIPFNVLFSQLGIERLPRPII